MDVKIKSRINNTGNPYSQQNFTATAKQYRLAKRYLKRERIKGGISVFKKQIYWFKRIINPKEPSDFAKAMIRGPKNWRFSNSHKAGCLRSEGIKIFDIDKLEGIQYGIDVFNDLSMREIVFFAYKMTSLAVIRGCANMCEHCFLSAKPARKSELSSLTFEDFKKITDGFNTVNKRINKVLRNKTGAYLTGNKQSAIIIGYNSELAALFHDSDGINVIAKDADGNEHDFIELTEMMLEATGKRGLFDSAGWNPKNKTLQQRAEKYAQYFSQAHIEKKVEQINLSVNTFNPLYTKSYKLGYRAGQENDLTNPNIIRGKLLYDTYIERISNMLVTLGTSDNARILITYSSRFEPNMDGMYLSDLEQILRDARVRCNEILKERYTGEEYLVRLKKINKLIDIRLSILDNRQVCTYYGRYQSLYNSRNPNDIKKEYLLSKKFDDINLLTPEEYNDFLKQYTAYVDTNGQIYYSLHEHSVRPMGKQLRISTNGQKTHDVPNLENRD